ncbi:MAG TPA: AAA family ATPase, partial [Flavobacteriaceae bacterium]|nr:AAA family ATPase [Flavobacteriaceae bacterium]
SIGEHTYGQNIYPNDVMTAGEFSVISGPSKSKKSFLKASFAAAFVGGNFNNHFENIKGHRKEESECIIDFDTEQSSYYAQRSFKNVGRMVGGQYANYYPFKLRRMSADERVSFIGQYLRQNQYKKNIRLVFIDGIADLVNDSNDLVMSNEVVEQVMTWTDIYDIHICLVIHNAHGIKKPTGHLGSSVTKKAETVIFVSPEENDKSIINVECGYSRGMAFDQFSFQIGKDSLPHQVNGINPNEPEGYF